MYSTFFPLIRYGEPGLKDRLLAKNIYVGMAGEYYHFYGANRELVTKHANYFTPETSMKMIYTQPLPGMWDFSYADQLVAQCHANGVYIHGHTAMWHMQNPDWLELTMMDLPYAEQEIILKEHVNQVISHYAADCPSFDVVNEFGAAFTSLSWGKYLGMDAPFIAFNEARKVSKACKLFYNSFFPTPEDDALAVDLVNYCDGLGIQLHLSAWRDYSDLFSRIEKLVEYYASRGKDVRFTEVTVLGESEEVTESVVSTFRKIIRLLLSFDGAVSGITFWGVKYPAWGGRHVLFDRNLNPTAAYHAVVDEIISSN